MRDKRITAGRTVLYIILIGYSLITITPFLWSIITSLKTQAEISAGNTILPSGVDLGAYRTILESQYTTWVGNSLMVAVIVTIVNVIFNTMAGYALARIDFTGKKLLFKLMLGLIMVPSQVTMIPAYIFVSKLGLIDTHFSIVITSAVSIAYIFMMRQFFVNFPKELEEAAAIDGLTKIGTFFRIVLPTALPAIATQAIFIFMGVWNEFMKPLLYISSPDKYLLTQGLNALAKQFKNSTSWNIVMAGSILSIIPIMLIYIFLNRYFTTSNDKTAGIK
ncbi:MAG: carbohydrate ABC transporter permease [Bacillota bacterium]